MKQLQLTPPDTQWLNAQGIATDEPEPVSDREQQYMRSLAKLHLERALSKEREERAREWLCRACEDRDRATRNGRWGWLAFALLVVLIFWSEVIG